MDTTGDLILSFSSDIYMINITKIFDSLQDGNQQKRRNLMQKEMNDFDDL